MKFVFDPLKRRYEEASKVEIQQRKNKAHHQQQQQQDNKLANPLGDNNPFRSDSTQASPSSDRGMNMAEKHTLKEVTIPDYYEDYDPSAYQYNDQYYNAEGENVLAVGKHKGSHKPNLREEHQREKEFNQNEQNDSEKMTENDVSSKSPNKKKNGKDSYYVDSFDYDYQYEYPKVHDQKFSGRKRRSNYLRSDRLDQRNSLDDKQYKPISENYTNDKTTQYEGPTTPKNASLDSQNQKESEILLDSRDVHLGPASDSGSHLIVTRDAEEYSTFVEPAPSFRSLEGVVRVAFTGLRMTSTYLIRGSAGDVFNFRERGSFNLSSPAVYLVSRVRLLLPAVHARHTRRSR